MSSLHAIGSVSRRSALRGLALLSLSGTPLLVAQGCAVRNPLEKHPEAEPVPVNPDVALRDSARAAISAQLGLIRQTRRTPTTRALLADLDRLHMAHLRVLDSPDPGSDPRPTGPGPRTAADILAGERALQGQLTGFAQRAQSGGFARLLASMAAALAQRVSR